MAELKNWEERLEPFFESSLRFLGEIPLSESDMQEMAASVRNLIQTKGLASATDQLVHKYPLTLITLMSSFSAFNTEHNYWQAFADLIGTDKNYLYNHQWHRQYVRLAKVRNLKVFDFDDGPTPYVTSIRFQGGIPAHSLPSFFERIVDPAVRREGLRELPVPEQLKYLVEHAYFVDSPVINFLENSGPLGAEFFTESCKLLKHAYKQHGEILPASQVDLPAYVHSAFEIWWEHREDERQHWCRPQLEAAPYDDQTAVNLKLPEQAFSLEYAGCEFSWQIEWPGLKEAMVIPCQVPHNGRNLFAHVENYVPILETPSQITVAFRVERQKGTPQELRRWNLSLLPGSNLPPLVAFTFSQEIGQEKRMLPASLSLPAAPLYLLFPADASLNIVGQAMQVDDCLPLVGAWSEWKMEAWDLSNAWSVQVKRGETALGRVIPVQGVIAQPELVDGHLFQYQDRQDLPFYTSELPALKVPLPAHANSLAGWQVHVRSLGEAEPAVDKEFKLSQYQEQVRVTDERAILPLKAILGETTTGTYEIEARGPRDLYQIFRFRIWPKLMISGHDMNLVAPAALRKDSNFNLHTDDHTQCEVQSGAEPISITKILAGWQVRVPVDTINARVDLLTANKNGNQIRVPVLIPMPKLRWGLAAEYRSGSLQMGRSLIARSIDKQLQSGSASIHVEMYGLGSMLYSLRLRLVEIGETEEFRKEEKFNSTEFSPDRLRIGLDQFKDSIAHINSLAVFELTWQKDHNSELVRIPLLELSRELEITDVAIECDSEVSCVICWHEEHPLKNRRVMIQPTWQPWQVPLEYKIPDTARGKFRIEGISLPRTAYQLYFYITPTWEAVRNTPPSNIQPHVVQLCQPKERLTELCIETGSDDEQFRRKIEASVILAWSGDEQKSLVILSSAARYLIHLTNLDLLLGTMKWIQNQKADASGYRSFFLKRLFHIQLITSMLDKYPANDPRVIEYLRITEQVPNSIPAETARLLLERVDEPVAVYQSLRVLLHHKDNSLVSIMVDMLSRARLTTRDVQALMADNESIGQDKDERLNWVLEQVALLLPGRISDELLAILLIKTAQIKKFQKDARLDGWILRAIPYEEEEQVLSVYLQVLFQKNNPDVIHLLLDLVSRGKIMTDQALSLLSMNPRRSLIILESTPDSEVAINLAEKLLEKFPAAAGILIVGSKLKTPVGISIVETITDSSGSAIQQIRLGNGGGILTLGTRNVRDNVLYKIDLEGLVLTIPGVNKVWKCRSCGGIHPDQRVIMMHRHGPGNSALSQISLPITINRDDIEILN
jgi:hypothetical protein